MTLDQLQEGKPQRGRGAPPRGRGGRRSWTASRPVSKPASGGFGTSSGPRRGSWQKRRGGDVGGGGGGSAVRPSFSWGVRKVVRSGGGARGFDRVFQVRRKGAMRLDMKQWRRMH